MERKKGMGKIILCITGPGHPGESWTITLDMGHPNCALRSCLNRVSSICMSWEASGESRFTSMDYESLFYKAEPPAYTGSLYVLGTILSHTVFRFIPKAMTKTHTRECAK